MVFGMSFENIDLKRKPVIIIITTGRLLYRFTRRKGGNINTRFHSRHDIDTGSYINRRRSFLARNRFDFGFGDYDFRFSLARTIITVRVRVRRYARAQVERPCIRHTTTGISSQIATCSR